MHTPWRIVAILVALATSPCIAGEIPGLAPQLPPFHERDYEFTFGNDFFGRGGEIDDLRTQQLIFSARLSTKWSAVLDHSILTLEGVPARVDQMSASLGHELFAKVAEDRVDKVVAGFGVRSVGRFAGERIQNGFHRIIDSDVEDFPYIDEDSTDVTGWINANFYRAFAPAARLQRLNNWQMGYWLRAASLITSGGQWDTSATALAVASRSSVDIWFGLRRDWRSGYDSVVLRETAAAEDDLAVVVGARFGALVIETVQQINNDASYGQLRLVSTGRRQAGQGAGYSRWGLALDFLLPDVQARITSRYRGRFLTAADSRWREFVIAAVALGEPQYENDNSIFVRTRQFDVGLELERPLTDAGNWLSFYTSAGAGWRTEKLVGDGRLRGETSQSVGRAAVTMSAGLRFNSAGDEQRWRFRTQIGVIATLPVSDADLQLSDSTYLVQQPAVNLTVGFSADFF